MSDIFKMVGDFHRKFGLPLTPNHRVGVLEERFPTLIDAGSFLFRYRFLMEELHELFEAYWAGDLPKVADALVDLTYVAAGTAHMMGIPFNECFEEVQRANMAKERAVCSTQSSRGSTLDVVKPSGWTPPDVKGVLEEHGYTPEVHGPGLDKWDLRRIRLALEVASWSKDPSTQVGAVLVGSNPGEVSLGYNGFPPGIRDTPERLADRALRLALTQHAERNVLDNCRFNTSGSTLYVTFFPCSECAKSLATKGVERIVTPEPSTREPWATDSSISLIVFDDKGIQVDYFPEPNGAEKVN